MHGWLIHLKRSAPPPLRRGWWESCVDPEGMTETLLIVHILTL